VRGGTGLLMPDAPGRAHRRGPETTEGTCLSTSPLALLVLVRRLRYDIVRPVVSQLRSGWRANTGCMAKYLAMVRVPGTSSS
jgi:hypothetical protein